MIRPRVARCFDRRGARDGPPRNRRSPATMEAYFHELADALDGMVHAGETGLAWLAAESTDFVRMNRGKVRQPGSVVQRYLDVGLVSGARQATRQLSLSGELAADRERIAAAVGEIRATLPDLADDPHLLIATVPQSSRAVRGGPLRRRRGDRRDGARRCRRARPRRPVRRRTGLSRLRQLARPAQLARGDRVQPAVEPLPPRRQGGEVGAVRLHLGRRRVRREDGRGARAARRHRAAAEDACAGQVPRRTSRRRRSRRSRRCCAGADSRRARSRRSRAASRGCAATARTASRSIRASR